MSGAVINEQDDECEDLDDGNDGHSEEKTDLAADVRDQIDQLEANLAHRSSSRCSKKRSKSQTRCELSSRKLDFYG